MKDFWKGQPVWPSPPDPRDWPLSKLVGAPAAAPETLLPRKASLLHHIPDKPGILNQGPAPMCSGAALTAIANAYFAAIGKLPPGGFSMRWLYHMGRKIANIPDDQDGGYPRAVLEAARTIGMCPESFCPSLPDWSKFTPKAEQLREAAKYKIKGYAALNVGTLADIERAIAAGRWVYVASIVTDKNWEDGWLISPEGYLRGSHAYSLGEFDRDLEFEGCKNFAKGPNSWGPNWAQLSGHLEMAEKYARWTSPDLGGMPALFEAWAVDFETPFEVVAEEPEEEVGAKYSYIAPPVNIDGRVYLSVRDIGIATSALVNWESDSKTVTLTYPDRVVTLPTEGKQYTIEIRK